jgi:HAD superfamily hydrolase (TIGR01509 family)
MGRFKAVIFDMDGTLLDSLPSVLQAYIDTVAALTGRTYSEAEVIETFPVGPGRLMLSTLLARPCTSTDLDLYHRQLEQRLANVHPYPGVEVVIEEMAAVLPLGVFTGAGRNAAEMLLGHTGLRHYFRAVVTGDDVVEPKPAPDGIIAACKELGVLSRAVAYVGDAPNDLKAAKAAGAMAVAAGWGHQTDPSFPGDLTINHPTELTLLFQ